MAEVIESGHDQSETGTESLDGVDFDLFSPDLNGPQYWDAIGELQSRGPLVWVKNYGGFWAATSHDMVRRIAQDWQTFSSAQGVSLQRPSPEQMPWLMPVEFDPPRQRTYRKEVNPHLTQKAMSAFEAGIRAIADDLIDGFIERGSCDITEEFARKFPGTVFFQLLVGADKDDLRRLEPWARIISFDDDPVKKGEAIGHLRAWVAGFVAARASRPTSPDVVQAVVCLGDTGVDFTEEELYSALELLALGGIGTSADLIGAIVCILSRDPDLQARVRNDLGLVPGLIEEALRLEPPLTVAFRTATCDVTVAGQDIKKGQKVGLFFGAANRDPAEFDHPQEVDIDRAPNPHLTFSAGVHRCIGSNLARLQVRVAVEQLLTRLSPFRIPGGARVEYMTRQERGPSSVPVEFPPGKTLVR
jgi:cytochrome P450